MFEVVLPEHSGSKRIVDANELRARLSTQDPDFWTLLFECTAQVRKFEDMHFLSTMRKKALARDFRPGTKAKGAIRLALIGGYTLYPLSEILEHVLFCDQFDVSIWMGEYDNYNWEVLESEELKDFNPDFVFFQPPAWRYKYTGKLSDPNQIVQAAVDHNCQEILSICEQAHLRLDAEIILCNFILPCYYDPGAVRSRVLASEWNSLKSLNLALGLNAANYIHICDLEFLSARCGTLTTRDDRSWLETKQPFAIDFICDVTKEIKQIIASARSSNKKVLVLDLDNTLWGGTIGDDGITGIDLGDTSPRGQSFKEFQKSIRELSDRGVLLAVCSKNNFDVATEPFANHPDMVLRLDDFVSFKANWEPKSDNITQMAKELGLSLDSFVFVDDNIAEIDIVSKFASPVSCVHLGNEPSSYVQLMKDSRYFEPRSITSEDLQRTFHYQQDSNRKQLLSTATDMDSYLKSLQMVALVEDFREVDVPRISQLINKSNQFNLTTKRRTEAEVARLIKSSFVCFTIRLSDRFGDLGLVSVVIAEPSGSELVIDTWLMSCRVLKRGVEDVAMNELMERSRILGVDRIVGKYIPSEKNSMVKDFFPKMRFEPIVSSIDNIQRYEAFPATHQSATTHISVNRGGCEKN